MAGTVPEGLPLCQSEPIGHILLSPLVKDRHRMLAVLLASQQTGTFDIAAWICDLTASTIRVYDARDDRKAGLDGLKIVQIGPSDYIGIYHAKRAGIFELHLARSRDLVLWKRVVTLDQHAHQGTLARSGKRWVVAYEKDGPKGNWIHVRTYNSLEDLLTGTNTRQKDLPRTLSAGAEGTPSIDSIRGAEDWNSSVIQLRFHYYRDLDVDRQAKGTLSDLRGWVTEPNTTDNAALDNLIQGNLGDRDRFVVAGKAYDLLEGQLYKNDWSSWRVLFCDRSQGATFKALPLRTDRGSVSFANPTGTVITLPDRKPGMVFTMFIPSQGAAAGEAGELIYAKHFP